MFAMVIMTATVMSASSPGTAKRLIPPTRPRRALPRPAPSTCRDRPSPIAPNTIVRAANHRSWGAVAAA